VEEKYPKLVFIDTDLKGQSGFDFLNSLPAIPFEIIFLSASPKKAAEAFSFDASGYLLKPIDTEALVKAVQRAKKLIHLRMENRITQALLSDLSHKQKNDNKLSIPTMSGLEFVSIKKIIRCEGLKRCTKIFIQNEKPMVSSNNIGAIAQTLFPHGFFQPHRSHIINLQLIKRYDREGIIVMGDNSNVPLSRRRKRDFLATVAGAR